MILAPTSQQQQQNNFVHPPPSYPDHVHSPTFTPTTEGCPDEQRWEPADLASLGQFSYLPSTDGPLQPWLGLKARLALAPVSTVLVSLVFVMMRLLMSTDDVDSNVDAAKTKLLGACKGAEIASSVAASLPHSMADSANQRTEKSVEGTVQEAGRLLYLGVVAIEAILVYLVDSYRSMYLCFIELLVRGTLSVLISAVEIISEAIKASSQAVRSAVQESIRDVNSAISAAVSGVNDIIGIFGQKINPPQFNIPNLDMLNNISVPTTFEDSLLKLNASLPTLDELRQKMDDLIRTPFESIKVEINQTVGGFRLDRSLLPVPSQSNISFCDEIDFSSLDELGHDLKRFAFIGAVILALLMAGIMLLCMGYEWWNWRSLKRHVENTREAWLTSDQSDKDTTGAKPEDKHGLGGDGPLVSTQDHLLSTKSLFSLMQLSTHPLLALIAFKVVKPLGIRSPKAKCNLRWFLAWISHPAALATLAAGVVGLFTIELQLMALRPIQSRYEGRIGGAFDSIGDQLLAKININMENSSQEFANKTNSLILRAENDLNDNLFRWVNITTETMNATLNDFMDGISEALNDAFSGTPLYTPLQTFIDCIIGRKVAGIESALTWIHENAHVDFSLVDPDVFMLSDDRTQQLVAPIKTAAVGDGSGSNGVVSGVMGRYASHLRKERLMFYIFLGIYGLVLTAGLIIVLWASINPTKRWVWCTGLGEWPAGAVNPIPPPAREVSALNGCTAQPGRPLISRPFDFRDGSNRINDLPQSNDQTVLNLASNPNSSWDDLLGSLANTRSQHAEVEAPSQIFLRLFGSRQNGELRSTSGEDDSNAAYRVRSSPDIRDIRNTHESAREDGQARMAEDRLENSHLQDSHAKHQRGDSWSSATHEPVAHVRQRSVSSLGFAGDRPAQSDEQHLADLTHAQKDPYNPCSNFPQRKTTLLEKARSTLLGAAAWWYGFEKVDGSHHHEQGGDHPPLDPGTKDRGFAKVVGTGRKVNDAEIFVIDEHSSTADSTRIKIPSCDLDPIPIPKCSPEGKRQLRFTTTPTDQVEARKKALEAKDEDWDGGEPWLSPTCTSPFGSKVLPSVAHHPTQTQSNRDGPARLLLEDSRGEFIRARPRSELNATRFSDARPNSSLRASMTRPPQWVSATVHSGIHGSQGMHLAPCRSSASLQGPGLAPSRSFARVAQASCSPSPPPNLSTKFIGTGSSRSGSNGTSLLRKAFNRNLQRDPPIFHSTPGPAHSTSSSSSSTSSTSRSPSTSPKINPTRPKMEISNPFPHPDPMLSPENTIVLKRYPLRDTSVERDPISVVNESGIPSD
ncbi:hypothetical protein IE53DRAFT_367513 [Violaceomyces palustris]|uniref:Uncharacterized protein n=1 Tax=Violaceomyces palustris TaxID=1673888 RepID=A0ACD0P1U9_9BASI|nr:hypothetical protein IE53DRAFT_367513 [Violaceomyces palustris]